MFPHRPRPHPFTLLHYIAGASLAAYSFSRATTAWLVSVFTPAQGFETQDKRAAATGFVVPLAAGGFSSSKCVMILTRQFAVALA